VFDPDLVRKLCQEVVRETDPEKTADLLTLLHAVIKDDQEEVRLRAMFLIRKYGPAFDDLMLVVDVVREAEMLASRLVRMRRGRASIVLSPNDKFQNEVTIAAYALGSRHDDPYDNIAGSHTVFFPRNHELSVEIHPSKLSFRPGEEASATIHVTSADGNEKESVLGLVVVDEAVEERAQTDRDFGGSSAFFRFRDEWLFSEELNGVRKKDLDKLDLTKSLPDGFEVAVEALLQSRGAGADIFTNSGRDEELHKVFASEIDPVLKPFFDALNRNYQQRTQYPKTETALRSDLLASGIRVDDLVDPWGTPFRSHFNVRNEKDVLEITSAGPDKKFDTEDDFQVTQIERPYFKPYFEAIQRALKEFHERTGSYIRDLEALKSELARHGIDLDTLKDPWGHAYRFEFGIHQTTFIITVMSAGPDGRFDTKALPSQDDFALGTAGIDYFSDTLAKIDEALNKNFKDTHSFPENAEQLEMSLKKSAISWGALRDPWGHPYYATFQHDAVYADHIGVETYENHAAKTSQRTQIVPVTRQINYVYIRSAGEDGIEGTSDDFYVASFSRVSFEQSGQNPSAFPAASAIVFSGVSGAIPLLKITHPV